MNWKLGLFGGKRGTRERSADTGSDAGAGADDAGSASGTVDYTFDPITLTLTRAGDTGPRASLSTEKRESEILAWRGWWLMAQKGEIVLRSVATATPWPAPLYTSGKPLTNDGLYSLYNQYLFGFPLIGERRADSFHGIHAVKRDQTTCDYIAACAVIGTVGLSGRVIEHEHGYRAERAMIRALYLRADLFHLHGGLPDVSPLDCVAQMRERYGCEVELFTEGETPWLEAAE